MSKKQKFTHTIKNKFIKVPKAVLQADIPLAALKVYLYLLDASATWTPSTRQIMKDLNMSKFGVFNSLKALEDQKMIEVERGDYTTKSKYKLTRWFENDPGLKNRPPWSEKQTTPGLKNEPPPGLKNRPFQDERSQMRDQDEDPKTAIYTKTRDNKGNLPIGQEQLSTEDLMKGQIRLQEQKIEMDSLAKKLRSK